MTKTYTVRGRGEFPVDMLRYDECEYATMADRAVAEGAHVPSTHTMGRREVTVRAPGGRRPTVARWESFGWTVVVANPAVGKQFRIAAAILSTHATPRFPSVGDHFVVPHAMKTVPPDIQSIPAGLYKFVGSEGMADGYAVVEFIEEAPIGTNVMKLFDRLEDARPVILSYAQTTDYDRIAFRVIPFKELDGGAQMYTLVEEKWKGDRCVADSRRQLSAEQFAALANAVRPVSAHGYVSDDGLTSPSGQNYPGGPRRHWTPVYTLGDHNA